LGHPVLEVLLEHQAVKHLARQQRRQQPQAGERHFGRARPSRGEPARLREPGLAGIDEREHVRERTVRRTPARACRRHEVEHGAPRRIHDPDRWCVVSADESR